MTKAAISIELSRRWFLGDIGKGIRDFRKGIAESDKTDQYGGGGL
jgi:hypothetical protein